MAKLLLTQKALVRSLTEKLGEKFSIMLGIDLKSSKSSEIFKWFLASILFGARITETIAINTYREFEKRKVITPDKILATGWDGLVDILDAGGYVRYDFKTATKLLEIMKALKEEYGGNLNELHNQAADPRDLERRIKGLGKGIGDVTTNIFLRELLGIWTKADPLPTELVILAARKLNLTKLDGCDGKEKKKILMTLKTIWNKNKVRDRDFANFEAALVRQGRDYCRKLRCDQCLLKKA